jgi:putative protein kinase ArgK-like GTPase of G3E family
MLETSSVKELAGAFLASKAHRIAIDGAEGSGKSTLAIELAHELT